MNSSPVREQASYGYSDFFSSGFRSLINRPAPVSRLSFTRNSSSFASKQAANSLSSSRYGRTKHFVEVFLPPFSMKRRSSAQHRDVSGEENGGTRRRQSVVEPSRSLNTSLSPLTPSSSGLHSRRLSLGAFFDRRQSHTSFVSTDPPDSRPRTPRTSRRLSIGDVEGLFRRRSTRSQRNRLSRQSSDNDRDVPEVWITKGGPYVCSQLPRDSNSVDSDSKSLSSVDPFASISSKSFYIDLPESNPPSPIQILNRSSTSVNQHRRRESFLSLSGSSPSSEPSPNQTHVKRNRERPTSVQTMPASLTMSAAAANTSRPTTPSRAYLKLTLGSRRDSMASGSILEEDEESLSAVHENWRDSMGGMDWRQFHMELLE